MKIKKKTIKKMTIEDLKEKIEKLPGNMRVMVSGQEDGYYDAGVEFVNVVWANLDEDERLWIYGDYNEADEDKGEVGEKVLFVCVGNIERSE